MGPRPQAAEVGEDDRGGLEVDEEKPGRGQGRFPGQAEGARGHPEASGRDAVAGAGRRRLARPPPLRRLLVLRNRESRFGNRE